MDCYDSQYCDEDCDNCELAKNGGWSPQVNLYACPICDSTEFEGIMCKKCGFRIKRVT